MCVVKQGIEYQLRYENYRKEMLLNLLHTCLNSFCNANVSYVVSLHWKF